jgi:beta-glucosidase
VLLIDFSNQWLLDRLEPGAAAVIGSFGVLTDAVLDLLTGRIQPRGRLPFTLPGNADRVGAEADVPGLVEDGYAYTDATGAVYRCGYGLAAF